MRVLRMVWIRARALVRRDAVDFELVIEIEQHLERLVDENLARGMTEAAAREAARREFGPVTQLIEASRDARGVTWIENAWHDARYGMRLIVRAPAFAAAVILTIALGIGAATAIFSVVYSVVLQPLPYREPDRLVNLWNTAVARGLPRAFVGIANVYDWKARNHVFDDIAVLRPVANFNLTGQGEPERLNGSRVSANLFSLLGATALHGRTFTEDENEIGHERVAILTYAFWIRRFGGDPGVVGRSILLNNAPHVVVGVMREDFVYPSRDYQIYVPLTFDPQELVNRMSYSYLAVARLRPDRSVGDAQAELAVLSRQIEQEHPRENEGIGAEVVPMLDDTVSAVRTPLYVLLGAVVAMLLIGCANIANLLLARALARQRELAMRAALGASRGRLIVQAVVEPMPMVAAGGALGVLLAAVAIKWLVPLLPADLPRVENIGIHWPVLCLAAAVLGAIAVFVGVWPAIEMSSGGASGSAAELSRGNTVTPARAQARDLLVVAQIAATLWLVVSAALLVRSFNQVRKVNPGFSADRVYTLHLAIPRGKYPSDAKVAAFGNQIVERVRALPDVAAAALVNRLPLAGGAQTGPVALEGIDTKAAGLGKVDYRSVTSEYFRTMRIPLLRGRAFSAADRAQAPPVAIIDERLARLFGLADPVGRRVRIPVGENPWATVIGVVGHIRHDKLEDDARSQIYFSFDQFAQDRMALVILARTDPLPLGAAAVGAIRALDPEQAVYDARTLDAVVARSVVQRRLQTMLLGWLAVIAVLLASIGVYGVVAFSVGQRTREFGIRLALGAQRAEIVGGVLRRGLVLFAAGGGLGLLAAAASARVLGRLLFEVSAFDATSFSAATLILFIVALAACGLPARRAAGVDPSIALRAE
jgi:putative ABC transport system permease protein